jgi:Domain of unknown function (DUF4386)
MTTSIANASPRLIARITGAFFLLTILTGIFAQGFVSERLVVFSDAAATANNILSNRGLFESGFTVYLIEMACQIAMTALFYVLLRPVSKSVAMVSTFWGLTGCVIKTAARAFYIAPLFVLSGGSALAGFNAGQLQSLALVLLKVNDVGAGIALAFFGIHTVLKGWLILRSTFLPRWLGVLSMISGLGWLTFFYPPLGYRAFPVIALLGLIASAVTIFWLLVFGVDEQRWHAQANAATSL